MEFALAAEQVIKVGANVDTWHAIWNASPVVKLTLSILVLMSVISWAIIFAKSRQFRRVEEANDRFNDAFWKANSLDEVYGKKKSFKNSPVAQLFNAGFEELKKIAESNMGGKGLPEDDNSIPKLSGIENLTRSLRKALDNEISQFELKLNFLATTGNTSPFIGLFGTVWGIMSAFQKIGATGTASLAVVAPGISEALIATAIGLATAIPAVVAYNHFIARLKKQELDLNNFTSDFLNIVKRNFFKDS